MRFSRFVVLPSVVSEVEKVRHAVRVANPGITEVGSIEAGTLVIGSVDDVETFYDSEHWFLTDECVLSCFDQFSNGFPLTEERRQLISLTLSRVRVGVIGFTADLLLEYSQMVTLMNGEFGPFSEDVDVVIADNAIAQGVFTARRLGIRVTTGEWLVHCYKQRRFVNPIEYQLPIFHKWTFTSTDLPRSEVNELKKIVLAHGGVWQSAYDSSVLSVIANRLLPTKKIMLALQAGVPIVTPDLVRDFDAEEFREFSSYTLNWWAVDHLTLRVFAGITFTADDDVPYLDIVKHLIEKNGGEFESPSQFHILPHGRKKKLTCETVSVHWVLACLEAKKIVSKDGCLIFRPLAFNLPIPGMENVQVSLVSIGSSVRSVLAEMVRILGGTVVYTLHKSSKYAVSDNPDDDLKSRAAEMNICVVNSCFILEMVKSGQVPDVKTFMFKEKVPVIEMDSKRTFTKEELESFTQEFTPNEMTTEVTYERSEQVVIDSQDLLATLPAWSQSQSQT